MSKINLEITVICPFCDNGIIETGPSCSKPLSDCCGVCYDQSDCNECHGDGEKTFNLTEENIIELLFELEDKDSEEYWNNVKRITKKS